jgi:two-component system sensor histidine kinase UhpB
MSLKLRIDLLFGLLLFLGMAADIGRMVIDGRSRVQAEGAAMTRVTRDFVDAALESLPASPDPQEALHRLTKSLDALRHVRVAFVRSYDPKAAALFLSDDSRREAPGWFFDLFHARNSVSVLPVVIEDRTFGDIVIASDPADEVNEVWQDVRNLALTGGAIAVAVLFGASLILARTLEPLSSCARALGRLRDGDYAARVEAAGSPEFVDLCAKINALAEELLKLSGDNQALIQQMMDVQEDERKRIAHELHDEFGPHLFALRANATVIETGLRKAGQETLHGRALAQRDQIEALQVQNRRILRQLRPPALDELGLCEALKILVEGWRERAPEVDIQLSLPEDLALKDEKIGLALFRIAQEALTNIFRHAKASHACVALSVTTEPREIRLKVQDDGIGVDGAQPAGLGLSGMRERVRSLAGRFTFGAAPDGGSLLKVAVPWRGPED